MTNLDALWQPITVGGLTIPNRVFVPAHEAYFAANKAFNQQYVDYLAERAKGGAGLVTIGASAVHPRGAANGHTQAWHPENVPVYRALADAVHEHGGTVFSQLFHCGHQDSGQTGFDWDPPMSASAVTGPLYDRQVEVMSQDDIDTVIEAFAHCADLVAQGGLDGVELSGGHGYLIGQFISPFTNRREDQYGGSLENRCRLAIEIATEIKQRCPDLPLGIRLSYDEYLGEVGITPDESDRTIVILNDTGLFDYFNISGINYHTVFNLVPPMTSGLEGHMVENARRAKAAIGGSTPILAANAIRTIEQAADVLNAGDADMVGLMRAHVADPEIVRKAKAGRAAEIRPCVRANQGCIRRGSMGKGIVCTVNPATGREKAWGVDRQDEDGEALNLVVVGGGPAGMQAAETAASRGHRVTLLERSGELGGSLRLAAALPARHEWLGLIDHLTGALDRLGVDVRLNTEADADTIRSLSPDAVVVATGAHFDHSGNSTFRPDRPGIPGADLPHVTDPAAVLRDPSSVGERVVIVDEHGNHAAMSLARMLAESGKSVEVVTQQLYGGQGLTFTMDIPFVLPVLAHLGVTLTAQSFCESIAPGEVTITDLWGSSSRTTPADTVILNLSKVSDSALFDTLQDEVFDVRRIGDARVPREVDDAIYEGERWGRTIASLARPAAATA
ncbi:unannotated protein [freshwater metagenome]|uniref:Unannotated protein n=1 Tax=freshwater metagenome TaxID=449393 RepID=A0A6J7JEZ5_9ZZZZ